MPFVLLTDVTDVPRTKHHSIKTCDPGTRGRYVRIQQASNTVLTLCEVSNEYTYVYKWQRTAYYML